MVPFEEPVAERGNVQIHLADSGTLGGRLHWRGDSWIKENVDER